MHCQIEDDSVCGGHRDIYFLKCSALVNAVDVSLIIVVGVSDVELAQINLFAETVVRNQR